MFVKLNTVTLKIMEWAHDYPPRSASQVTFWASYVLMFQPISNPLYYKYLPVFVCRFASNRHYFTIL